MVAAPVGFQCPECVRSYARVSRLNEGQYGGRRSYDPKLTSIVLIIVNAVVWGVIWIAGRAGMQDRVVDLLGLAPQGMCASAGHPGAYYGDVGPSACGMIPDGVWVPGVADGAWWQLFTSIFTHVSVWHIAVNCLSLWFIGPQLESVLGRVRFLATYLVAGLFGSLAVYWLSDPQSISLGGSGSLFGLMGALLVVFWRERLDVKQLLMWIGLNVLITVLNLDVISWQAHLGGFVGGAVLAGVWVLIPPSPARAKWQWLAVGALVVVIGVGIGVRTAMLA